MPKIATSATVDPRAEIAEDVEVGPGCYIGPLVRIGPCCRLIANVTVIGHTAIGHGNLFYPGAVIGAAPQDLKYKGSNTRLTIGNENIFRECVTVHTGTEVAGGQTEVGSYNQFQVGTHLAHDVHVGDHCILSNSVQIAGHVHIEDHVNISGLVGVQQFVTLGQFCFVTGASRCTTDTPPYLIFGGYDGTVMGVNVKGLGRWGFDEPSIQRLRDVCKKLFPKRDQPTNAYRLRSLYKWIQNRRHDKEARDSFAKRLSEAEAMAGENQHCRYLIDFLKRSTSNGVHGRYLESLRRDDAGLRAAFFERGAVQ